MDPASLEPKMESDSHEGAGIEVTTHRVGETSFSSRGGCMKFCGVVIYYIILSSCRTPNQPRTRISE